MRRFAPVIISSLVVASKVTASQLVLEGFDLLLQDLHTLGQALVSLLRGILFGGARWQWQAYDAYDEQATGEATPPAQPPFDHASMLVQVLRPLFQRLKSLTKVVVTVHVRILLWGMPEGSRLERVSRGGRAVAGHGVVGRIVGLEAVGVNHGTAQ